MPVLHSQKAFVNKVVWHAGSAGKLQVQLMDTGSKSGSSSAPLATAAVDLDMRQWRDCQTYQAEVPLVAEGVPTATVTPARLLIIPTNIHTFD